MRAKLRRLDKEVHERRWPKNQAGLLARLVDLGEIMPHVELFQQLDVEMNGTCQVIFSDGSVGWYDNGDYWT